MEIKQSYREDHRLQAWLSLKDRVPSVEFSAALDGLNSTTCRVLKMVYDQGYSVGEIAKDIGKSVSVVRNHRNKGIFKLKQQFKKLFEPAKTSHTS
jgi:DNA-directed RNA polymerase specialized sigma24 family protein